MKSTYSEPTVLWRLRHADGRTAYAKVIPVGKTASAVWFIGELAEDAKDFDDWASAVQWAEEMRADLEATGWLGDESRRESG